MRIEDIQFLYEYNYWANHKILAAAGMLTEEQYLAPRTYSHGGVRDTLVHILSAEWIWRVRCEEQLFPTAVLSAEDFLSLESLQQRWQQEEGRMRGYVTGLSDEALDRKVMYKTTGGKAHENVLWHLLVHVVNHGTEHRSTVAEYLTEDGHSPGDLDMVFFARGDFQK
jgi:uncharacterized damage-inducible protein DinB